MDISDWFDDSISTDPLNSLLLDERCVVELYAITISQIPHTPRGLFNNNASHVRRGKLLQEYIWTLGSEPVFDEDPSRELALLLKRADVCRCEHELIGHLVEGEHTLSSRYANIAPMLSGRCRTLIFDQILPLQIQSLDIAQHTLHELPLQWTDPRSLKASLADSPETC